MGMDCRTCGSSLPDGARFCPSCGALVTGGTATDERKMVTVLFADLVDSTGLSQRLDAERAREVLGRFYDVTVEELHALRGRPEKFIGDAVMAVFGLPQVHEDDALRAVRAGIAIRERVRRLCEELGLATPLEIRVGIESGEAATGRGPDGQLLVTGSVVNAAARLQTAAEPGEVLAGETTRTLTERAVSFGEERLVEAKGFVQPLSAYCVEGLSTRSARRTIPFVGRADELAMLRRLVLARDRHVATAAVHAGRRARDRQVEARRRVPRRAWTPRARCSSGAATWARTAPRSRRRRRWCARSPASRTTTRPRSPCSGCASSSGACCRPGRTRARSDRCQSLLGLDEPRRDESAFVHDVRAGFLTLIEGLAERTTGHAAVRGRADAAPADARSDRARRRARAPRPGPGAGRSSRPGRSCWTSGPAGGPAP